MHVKDDISQRESLINIGFFKLIIIFAISVLVGVNEVHMAPLQPKFFMQSFLTYVTVL